MREIPVCAVCKEPYRPVAVTQWHHDCPAARYAADAIPAGSIEEPTWVRWAIEREYGLREWNRG